MSDSHHREDESEKDKMAPQTSRTYIPSKLSAAPQHIEPIPGSSPKGPTLYIIVFAEAGPGFADALDSPETPMVLLTRLSVADIISPALAQAINWPQWVVPFLERSDLPADTSDNAAIRRVAEAKLRPYFTPEDLESCGFKLARIARRYTYEPGP